MAMKTVAQKVLVLLFVFSAAFYSSALAHTDVNAPEAHDMIVSNPQLILVDVREESEYCDVVGGHIPGALSYPWNSGVFEASYQELPMDAEILIYCRSGRRSDLAAEFLDSQGHLHVYNMLGGILTWEWETVGCVDADGDVINDDLDNCPEIYNPSQADSDNDGTGNVCDPNCPNLDGLNPVGLVDFAILMSNWQLSGPAVEGDLNADGTVDANDLAILGDYWLSECYEE
jgi:rhodanese-related sulfurtransferase